MRLATVLLLLGALLGVPAAGTAYAKSSGGSSGGSSTSGGVSKVKPGSSGSWGSTSSSSSSGGYGTGGNSGRGAIPSWVKYAGFGGIVVLIGGFLVYRKIRQDD